jgi:HEAT repeat protein
MPKHLDDATFLARLAAFASKSTPTEALALARLGDERALPALIAAMTDTMEGEHVSRYREAVRTLVDPPLLQRWLTGDLDARRIAAHALSAHDPQHAPLIADALVDPDDQVRAIARRSLRAWTASPPLHQLFRGALTNPDARIRLLAAEGLGKLGDPEDIALLSHALETEPEDSARDRIAWAIEKLEDDATE